MTINQISLFLENKPGHLAALCAKLAEANINIITLSLADTQQFGIVRLIVDDWCKAQAVLEGTGYVINVREVVAAAVPDKPGGLALVLNIVGQAEVNIEYMYAFAFRHGEEAVLVFRFDDPEKAVAALQAAGRSVFDSAALLACAR